MLSKEKIKEYNKRHRKYKTLWQKKQREDPEFRKYEKAKDTLRKRKKGIMSWAERRNKYEGNLKWKSLKN